MKKIVLRSVFMFLLTVFLLFYVLKDNFKESVNLLISSNFLYLFLAIFICFLAFLAESYMFKLLINKHKKEYTYKNTIILNIMTRFFNGITPFSLGGQPLQVYELSKNDVKVTDGVLVVTEIFIIHEISLTIITIFALILKCFLNITPNSFLWTLTIVGLIINIFALLTVAFVSIKIDVAKKIGRFLIKILNKIHIIKKEEITIKKWDEKCNEYFTGFKDMINNKKIIIKCVLVNILNLTLFFSISYFTILAIDSSLKISIFYTFILSVFVYVSTTFVPIPGGSVGAEYAYVKYFELIIMDNIVVTSLILWRFISYYLPMIIGGIVFNVIDNKRSIMCKDATKNI